MRIGYLLRSALLKCVLLSILCRRLVKMFWLMYSESSCHVWSIPVASKIHSIFLHRYVISTLRYPSSIFCHRGDFSEYSSIMVKRRFSKILRSLSVKPNLPLPVVATLSLKFVVQGMLLHFHKLYHRWWSIPAWKNHWSQWMLFIWHLWCVLIPPSPLETVCFIFERALAEWVYFAYTVKVLFRTAPWSGWKSRSDH